MCDRLEDLIDGVRGVVARLSESAPAAARAAALVELFSELDRLAVGGRTLVAARVAQTRAWFGSGAPSMAAWMASRTGSSLRQSSEVIAAAARLESLPETRGALASGRLSEAQLCEIAPAALADPASEPSLVELASRESVSALRERCRDVIAAAAGEEESAERIRRGRYLRHWTEPGGAVRLDARLAPEDAAGLLTSVGERACRLLEEARRAGQHEPPEAYGADALCSLPGVSSRAVVHVHVSADALARGRTAAGETCRIEGVGPIPVASARRLAMRGSVTLIETHGRDVRRVAHAGRAIPAHVRTALEARDPACVVPGCNRRRGLEIDHVVPLSEGGRTELRNLCRLCRWHHAQKTHHGWVIEGGPGAWVWRRGRHMARGP